MTVLSDIPGSSDLISTADTFQTGDVFATVAASAPAGWLLCDGSAVSRATYAALFAAIGTSAGAGDGSTTFNVPDCRGLTVTGVRWSGPGSTFMERVSQIDHVHGGSAYATSHQHSPGTLTMPSHYHYNTISVDAHVHSIAGTGNYIENAQDTTNALSSSGGNIADVRSSVSGGMDYAAGTVSGGTVGPASAPPTGSSAAGNPPGQVFNFIIKT